MAAPVIVVHYHELWLRGEPPVLHGKFIVALRRALAEFPVMRMGQPATGF